IRTWFSGSISVSQSVHGVIGGDPVRERGERLRITGVVGVFYGIAHIHVVADACENASFFVVDGPPFGFEAVVLVLAAGIQILHPRNLVAVVQIIYDVKNGILVIYIHDGTVGKN